MLSLSNLSLSLFLSLSVPPSLSLPLTHLSDMNFQSHCLPSTAVPKTTLTWIERTWERERERERETRRRSRSRQMILVRAARKEKSINNERGEKPEKPIVCVCVCARCLPTMEKRESMLAKNLCLNEVDIVQSRKEGEQKMGHRTSGWSGREKDL